MDQNVINNCYKNSFGIDLKQYHKKICHIDSNESSLIATINKNNRVVFEDGISSDFKLVLHNSLLYLLGDKTCYPCSKTVESAYGSEFNWVRCVVVPGTVKIVGETDIRKSGIIVSLFSDLVTEISNEEYFYNFIDQLVYTFSGCEWFKRIYSLSLYIRLVEFWDYKQKIACLFEHGLLYPLEFAIYTIYKQVDIKNDSIMKYFID